MIFEEIDLARDTILPAGDLRGRLRLAAPLSFGPTHLAPVLAELAKRHPLLQVNTSYSDRFVDIVSARHTRVGPCLGTGKKPSRAVSDPPRRTA